MRPMILAMAIAATATCALSAQTPKAPEPTKPVDAAGFFAGRWWEIARTPMKLTDGCVAGYTDYQTRGNGLYQRDACRDRTPAGKEKVIGGPLKILDPGRNTKVHVSYQLFGLVPVGRDYWMLDHGDGWFIQATPDLKMVNIYTRDPRPPPELVAKLSEELKGFGYDPAKLEFPALSEAGKP
jgi:apolipoprotein D and lipocalin family protein